MSKADGVSLAFLGGVAEIGKNMSLIESGGRILVIDAGLGFPGDEMLGVDLVLPDWSYLLDNQDRIDGLVLTHGHEDHVGALPYFLQELERKIDIWGSRLTLGLVKEKLAQEYPDVDNAAFHLTAHGDAIKIGPFAMEFIKVNHSIPDGLALGIWTGGVRIVHSGDYKFDLTPIDGAGTDFAAFARWGETGVDLFVNDCTNIEVDGFTPSEMVVRRRFENIFSECGGRIIIATFASNIGRLQLAIDVARMFSRKVVPLGRSMVESIGIGRELGFLRNHEGVLLERDDLDELAPEETVILGTGTQGEPLSALSLMSRNAMKDVTLTRGDTVIISARPIPGNEALVHRIVNNLSRRGARVLWRPETGVHVSGHAALEEQKMLLNIIKPRAVVPFHGEPRHQALYSEMAQSMGYSASDILLVEPGDVVHVTPKRSEVRGRIPSGMIFVDGAGIGDVGRLVLKDRRRISQEGIVVVSMALDGGRIAAGPELESRGFVFPDAYEEMLAQAVELAVSETRAMLAAGERDRGKIGGRLRSVLGRLFYQAVRRQPVVVTHILEAGGRTGAQDQGMEEGSA